MLWLFHLIKENDDNVPVCVGLFCVFIEVLSFYIHFVFEHCGVLKLEMNGLDLRKLV